MDHRADALAVAIRELTEHEFVRQRMGEVSLTCAERELSPLKSQQSVSESLELRTSSAPKR